MSFPSAVESLCSTVQTTGSPGSSCSVPLQDSMPVSSASGLRHFLRPESISALQLPMSPVRAAIGSRGPLGQGLCGLGRIAVREPVSQPRILTDSCHTREPESRGVATAGSCSHGAFKPAATRGIKARPGKKFSRQTSVLRIS
jgi:hypothetical protein